MQHAWSCRCSDAIMALSMGLVVQVAWKSGNPWHSKPAVDAQATCSTGSGKLFEQPVHAVHAFTLAWPPPPPPRQVWPAKLSPLLDYPAVKEQRCLLQNADCRGIVNGARANSSSVVQGLDSRCSTCVRGHVRCRPKFLVM